MSDIDFTLTVSYFECIEPAAPLFYMRNSAGVFFNYLQFQSIFNLIAKQAVAQLGKQLVPQLTHQDTSKYIYGNSTLHATQRCGLGKVFLFINRKGSSKEEPFLLPSLITSIHIWEGRIMACIHNIIQKKKGVEFLSPQPRRGEILYKEGCSPSLRTTIKKNPYLSGIGLHPMPERDATPSGLKSEVKTWQQRLTFNRFTPIIEFAI